MGIKPRAGGGGVRLWSSALGSRLRGQTLVELAGTWGKQIGSRGAHFLNNSNVDARKVKGA